MANGWRGCSDVTMRYHGDWSDPDLVIEKDGDLFVFNYWDIESALWEEFLEYNGITESDTMEDVEMGRGSYNISDEWEQKFNEYCQENAYNYMEDCIYSGYFGSMDLNDDDVEWDPYDEEYTWHYNYRDDSEKEIDTILGDLLDSDAYWAYKNTGDKVTRRGKNYFVNDKEIGTIDQLESYYDDIAWKLDSEDE
jgi:hypothetical protein